MTVLATELTFPAAPITSVLKRISKGIEQLYYTSLFLKNATYDGPEIWRSWLEQGFNVNIFSPPPGTASDDRIRVRVQAPSPTPVVSVEGSNTDALKDLESLLRVIDGIRVDLPENDGDARSTALHDGEFGRLVVDPLVQTLRRHGFQAPDIDAYLAMLQRGFDALTHREISAVELKLS